VKIALIQQHATDDKAINIQRGLDNIDTAAANGAVIGCCTPSWDDW
jgi:hypothetical protein|tara:strand:- start:788 stop:925 length:138 start_codon:yes stop_codon:yes gene_type:complete